MGGGSFAKAGLHSLGDCEGHAFCEACCQHKVGLAAGTTHDPARILKLCGPDQPRRRSPTDAWCSFEGGTGPRRPATAGI